MKNITKAGGKRKGAGRKKSAPYKTHLINLDAEMLIRLKNHFGVRDFNDKIRILCKELDKSLTSET
jgi:hypothetical protein